MVRFLRRFILRWHVQLCHFIVKESTSMLFFDINISDRVMLPKLVCILQNICMDIPKMLIYHMSPVQSMLHNATLFHLNSTISSINRLCVCYTKPVSCRNYKASNPSNITYLYIFRSSQRRCRQSWSQI